MPKTQIKKEMCLKALHKNGRRTVIKWLRFLCSFHLHIIQTGFGEQIQSCSDEALHTSSKPASIRHVKVSLQAYPRTKD